MKKLKKLFSIVIASCLVLGSMTGVIVQAAGESEADECVVADFGDSTTVDRIAAVQDYYAKSEDITYNGSASSLKITAQSWGFYLTDADNKAMVPAKTDVSSYKYFRMRIYSENKGDSFVVMLSSDNSVDGRGVADRRFVVTTQGTGWQEVAIALSDSINNGAEWNSIGGVYLKTGVNSTSTASGHEIYIDKIWFGNTAGDEIDPADRYVIADFSDATFSQTMAAKKVYGPEDTVAGFTVENTTTIKPDGTAIRWNFAGNNNVTPTIVNTQKNVSAYDNVRIRFYSPNKDDKFVLFAAYKDQNNVSKNPYFYYVVTSNGNGWQDVKIPKSKFTAGGARPIVDGGENIEPTWENISAMYMEISGSYGSAMPSSEHSLIVDSILFENDEKVDPKPPEEVKEPVIIADFADKDTVEDAASNQGRSYLSKSTDRTYRKAASSLKVTFPDYGFYVLTGDGKAFAPQTQTKTVDVSKYKYFRMRIYSKHAGDKFMAVVRSGDAEESVGGTHFRGEVTTTGVGWQEVAIPLSAFDARGGSWTNVGGVYLRPVIGTPATTADECMYIDKIWFADTDGSEDKIDHIMSDELYIDETDGVINGFYGMTVAQVRENILLPDNMEITFYDADGEEITDESVPAVSGMTATLSNDGGEYMLDSALYDFRDMKFNGVATKKFSQGPLQVVLNAQCYRQGITVNANLIVAQYSDDDRLIGIEYTPGIITSSGATNFTVDYNVSTAENTKIRVYVWEDFKEMNSLMDNQTIELTPAVSN